MLVAVYGRDGIRGLLVTRAFEILGSSRAGAQDQDLRVRSLHLRAALPAGWAAQQDATVMVLLTSDEVQLLP